MDNAILESHHNNITETRYSLQLDFISAAKRFYCQLLFNDKSTVGTDFVSQFYNLIITVHTDITRTLIKTTILLMFFIKYPVIKLGRDEIQLLSKSEIKDYETMRDMRLVRDMRLMRDIYRH